ncbi:hypothetical protein [Frankia sp. Cppng1_Ct_nod]|uniref:hypothetical protein n=1 Tax=Frankia sp. Cppng1_Ct_nod TaxID=2897162 RepID=UPI001041B1DA|nr:hypothetical protein [Frankia sp. Cppng1_Ct_nod]
MPAKRPSGTASARYLPRPVHTATHSDIPPDTALYGLVVYGRDEKPTEVRLPFPTVSAADHHAKSHGIDGRVVPIVFPIYPRSET